MRVKKQKKNKKLREKQTHKTEKKKSKPNKISSLSTRRNFLFSGIKSHGQYFSIVKQEFHFNKENKRKHNTKHAIIFTTTSTDSADVIFRRVFILFLNIEFI